MRLQGLKYVGLVKVPRTYIKDILGKCSIHSVGDGEWTIEAYHVNGTLLKEFCGENGTRTYVGDDDCLHNVEADDLWSELDKWAESTIYKDEYSYKDYQAPDGTTGSYSFFVREVGKGHLHGLVVIF